MTTIWPCDTCGAAGVRNMGARGYCRYHYNELYDRLYRDNGVGIRNGLAFPEYGPRQVRLECNWCHATWVGEELDRCTWCADRKARKEADMDAELDQSPTVYGYVMCNYCQRIVADIDEWEICGAHGGKTTEGHYCNGSLRRFTKRTAERLQKVTP